MTWYFIILESAKNANHLVMLVGFYLDFFEKKTLFKHLKNHFRSNLDGFLFKSQFQTLTPQELGGIHFTRISLFPKKSKICKPL
jgi:hypothetical protein